MSARTDNQSNAGLGGRVGSEHRNRPLETWCMMLDIKINGERVGQPLNSVGQLVTDMVKGKIISLYHSWIKLLLSPTIKLRKTKLQDFRKKKSLWWHLCDISKKRFLKHGMESCISFLGLVNQSVRDQVVFNIRKLFSYSSGGQESKIKVSADFWGSEWNPLLFLELLIRTVNPRGSSLAASSLPSLLLLPRVLPPVGLSITKSPSLNNEATSHILWRTQPIPLRPHLY